MAKTRFDYSDLNADERVELAEELWDSIAGMQDTLSLTSSQAEELDRRLESYRRDGDPGTPWMEALRKIEDSNR
jgi:putative addiction module component (TIGR02574 family)